MTSRLPYLEANLSSNVDHRYVPKREIARGAMGVVFEAEHKWLRTRIALKTLTAGVIDSPNVHARLMREARALSLARHPGVVDVLDAGTCALHGPYVALELFDGRSLESLVTVRQRLDVESVVQVAQQLGSALAHVHGRGVVHRDIKPGNVLVGREPGRAGDVVKLLDFGLATVPDEADVVSRKLTGDREMLGTVEYMAPELLLFDQRPTPASDLYGFGVLLYECLTGDVPHPGRAVVVSSALLEGRRPVSVRALRPDVPIALDEAILRALAIDPAERFGSALELAAACAEALPASARLQLIDMPRRDAATRRGYPRVPFSTPVSLTSSGAERASHGRTEDISEGGVLVVTEAGHVDGQEIVIRLPLPGSGLVTNITGVARWQRSHRGRRAMGVEFTKLSDAAREDIQRYVAMMIAALPNEDVAIGRT